MDETKTRREFSPRDTAAEAIAAIDDGLAAAEKIEVPDELVAERRALARLRTAEAVDRLLGPDTPLIWTASEGHLPISQRRRENEAAPTPRDYNEDNDQRPWHRDRHALLQTQMAGRRGVTPTELADRLNCSRAKAYHSLDRLWRAGKVRKQGRGRYVAVEEVNR